MYTECVRNYKKLETVVLNNKNVELSSVKLDSQIEVDSQKSYVDTKFKGRVFEYRESLISIPVQNPQIENMFCNNISKDMMLDQFRTTLGL